MLNLVFALVAALVVGGAIALAGFSWVAAVIPAAVVFVGAFIVLGRRTLMQFQAIMGEVQKELGGLTPHDKPRDRTAKIEKAVKLLEGALPLSRYQFLLDGQIYAEIGSIRYAVKDLTGAEAAFKKATARHHYAQAMYAALNFQRENWSDMEACFEKAVLYGKKEGMLWAAYAWCQLERKEKDKALAILQRGVATNPSDEKLKAALLSLQNDKKLKMRPWEPMWWQLGLETPPVQKVVRFR